MKSGGPLVLYRGENIVNGNPNRVGTFKRLFRHGLPLDFINGGNPYRVQQLGLLDTTVRHVAENSLGLGSNSPKHFISFSEDQGVAETYATTYWDNGDYRRNEYEVEEAYYTEDLNSYQDASIWDDTRHLLIELDISSGETVHATCPFLKSVRYNGGQNRILALNVTEYLDLEIARIGTPSQALLDQFPGVLEKMRNARELANGDREWLIACLDPIPPQSGVPPSFSALIAPGDIWRARHQVDPDFFVR